MGKKKQPGWNASKSAAENARLKLPLLVAAYFEAGRQLILREPSADELHRFRLEGKRLRYTLELFRPCYGPSLVRAINALREIQQHLGDCNDCAATMQLLADRFPNAVRQKRQITRFLQARAAESLAKFREQWREKFDAPGQERRWLRYLSR